MDFTLSGIFEFLGFEAISGIDIVFAAMALIGGVLFFIYFILFMIGGIVDGAIEGIFDVDIDMDSAFVFEMITLQGIIAFIMMFGLVGLGVSQSDASSLVAIGAGTGAGLISMYIMGQIFKLFKSMEDDGTVDYTNSLGAKGTVYLTIPKDGQGQVQVTYQDALRTSPAISQDGSEIKTGTFIEVVDNLGQILIVNPVNKRHLSSISESE